MGMIRKTASKEKIKQAFIVLLETEGFQKMTISSLVKQAGINRGTFYLNYLDKDDLAQQLVNDFFTDIAAILKQDNGDRNDWFSPAAISQIIEYVQNNFAFAHALLNSDLKGDKSKSCFPKSWRRLFFISMPTCSSPRSSSPMHPKSFLAASPHCLRFGFSAICRSLPPRFYRSSKPIVLRRPIKS